ncbi:hypothetical protein G6L68_25055 [Agrobacterium fabrum]|uniref:hypothetical protein n=1 Tax=Agrobacterium fabrum TaxID=1176649 RepID=UPI000EF59D29|nr:hypothetical protein [Agrobacterium fabrum]AYM66155.1 hypothetical protein At12D13_50030 [Agrobacterium fabrum]NTE63902.1 hypothetical protein [Agrobacterium fabrum]
MTLSRTDRAALKAMAAALPDITDPDDIRGLADWIGSIPAGGNKHFGNLLWLAQWAVGDIGQNEHNDHHDDIETARRAINGVLDYRPAMAAAA